MRRLSTLFLCLLLASRPAIAACAVDGFVTDAGSGGATTYTTGAITTTQSNDVLVMFVSTNLRTNTGTAAVTGITGGGLTWTLRKQVATVTGASCWGGPPTTDCSFDQEEWWTVAPSPLTSQQFVLAMNATWQANTGFTIPLVVAYSGLAIPAAPWDSNSSVPASATNLTSSPSVRQINGVSTTNANDILLFACFGNQDSAFNCRANSGQGWSGVTGFTKRSLGDGFFNSSSLFDLPVLTTFTNVTLDVDNVATSFWSTIADALVCAAAGPVPAPSHPFVWIHE